MVQKILLGVVLCISAGALTFTYGQGAGTPAKATLVPGDVVSINSAKIVISTKDGNVDAILSAKTEFKKMSAEKPSPATATPSALADISVGDKLIVSGFPSADKKTM